MRVQVRQANLRMRILRRKLLRIDTHIVQPDGVNHGHTHRSTHQSALRGNFRLRFFEVVEQHHTRFKELLSLRRDHERPLRAVDQLGAELLFKLAHRLARSGLGNAVGRRAKGKTPRADDIAVQT